MVLVFSALAAGAEVLAVILGVPALRKPKETSRKRKLAAAAAQIAVIVLGFGGLVEHHAAAKAEKAKAPTYAGALEPGRDASPPLPPGTPQDVIQLFLGKTVRVLGHAHLFFVITSSGKPVISLAQEGGRLFVSTTLRDYDGRLMVRLIRNEFQAFAETTFNPIQPDSHSLVVRDTEGREVLNLRFANPRVFRLSGRFAVQGSSKPLIIDDSGITFPNGAGLSDLTLDRTGPEISPGMIELR